MFLDVSVEVGLLAEAAITLVALKRLLLVVDVSDMSLEVRTDRETTVTVGTLKENKNKYK